jgi:dTDP-glucose 4,6-dehydratase
MKKVVVIGSNSFSGSDFIDLLINKNTYQVLGVSRSKEKDKLFLPYKNNDLKNFSFFQCDLNHNIKELEKKLDDFQPDYIINFAAQSEVSPSWKNPTHWYETNVVALTNFVDMLKNKKYLKKYIHISSPEVYGTCHGIVKEDHFLNPSTPYAASKASGDLSLFTFYKNYNFPLIIVRSTNVYGTYQQLFKIIPRSIICIKQGKKIPLHGGGQAIKSYIHIRDVSNGELQVMENGKSGEIYHISPGNGIAVKDVVAIICSQLKVPFNDFVKIVEERLGQDKAYIIDSSKIRNELGWREQITFDLGIKGVIKWIEANFSEIVNEPLEYVHKR